MMSPLGALASGLLVVAALQACGEGATRARRGTTPIELEPVKIVARRPVSAQGSEATAPTQRSRGLTIDAYDARELLERGNRALSDGRFDDALDEYERLIREFPRSRLVSAAHYNAALALERSGRLEQAAARYERLATERPRSQDAIDALFQAARAYERLERWDDVQRVLATLESREGLTTEERVEALARRGAALVEGGDEEEGERELRRAVALGRHQGVEALRTDYYLAEAQYYLGEIPRRESLRIPLTNEEVQFRRALEQRCGLLLEAQTQYVQTIRIGNAHWAAAAAFRIGQMYSRLYDDVMAVPVPEVEPPPELTHPEEQEIFRREFPQTYRRLLRQHLAPLLHNAIRWWESNLMMMERTGVDGTWPEETRRNLERVQRLLDEIENEQDEEGGSDDPPDEGEGAPTSRNHGSPRGRIRTDRDGNVFA